MFNIYNVHADVEIDSQICEYNVDMPVSYV